MTLEKEKRSKFFWRKSHSQQSLTQPVAVDNAAVSADTNHISFQPDAGSTEFVEKDVNLTSLFGPFIKNYVSNLSHHQV